MMLGYPDGTGPIIPYRVKYRNPAHHHHAIDHHATTPLAHALPYTRYTPIAFNSRAVIARESSRWSTQYAWHRASSVSLAAGARLGTGCRAARPRGMQDNVSIFARGEGAKADEVLIHRVVLRAQLLDL